MTPATADERRAYYDLFGKWADVLSEFSVDDEAEKDEPKFVFAAYLYEDYSGDAQVFYSRDGKTFYSVSGSHCSCYGLEGMWEPIETPIAAMRHLITEGGYYGVFREYRADVIKWLEAVEASL